MGNDISVKRTCLIFFEMKRIKFDHTQYSIFLSMPAELVIPESTSEVSVSHSRDEKHDRVPVNTMQESR